MHLSDLGTVLSSTTRKQLINVFTVVGTNSACIKIFLCVWSFSCAGVTLGSYIGLMRFCFMWLFMGWICDFWLPSYRKDPDEFVSFHIQNWIHTGRFGYWSQFILHEFVTLFMSQVDLWLLFLLLDLNTLMDLKVVVSVNTLWIWASRLCSTVRVLVDLWPLVTIWPSIPCCAYGYWSPFDRQHPAVIVATGHSLTVNTLDLWLPAVIWRPIRRFYYYTSRGK